MIRKVLFVDDDKIMLLALQKRLAKYSDIFSIVLAEDGFDAVRKLKEISVSLVVMDLKMPRMDGMSLLSHISGKYPDIPVVIISGYRTEEMYRLAKEKEVVAYISKPFQVDDLAKVILSTLRKEAEGGTLHNVSPVVFLQLMEMESRTCTIRLIDRTTEKGGVLYFRDGSLVDARVDQVKGINAAYQVFTWEDVTLFIRNECPVEVNVINSGLQPIIMKAVGMKDEQATFIAEEEECVEEDPPDEEVPVMEEERQPEPGGVGQVEDEVGQIVAEAPVIDRVKNLLHKEIGERCGLEDIYHDNNAGKMINSMSQLGAMFNFGSFRVGYVDRGLTTDEILVPAEPAILIKVSSKCPQDKILQVLSTHM